MFNMEMKPSNDREVIKERVRKWMRVSGYTSHDAADAAVLETYFYIYNMLENGSNIREIGMDLGIFPTP
jgi:hypothetical protein